MKTALRRLVPFGLAVAAVVLVALLRINPKATDADTEDLVPFRDPETYLWGYRDRTGTVRIAPAFTFADDQWHEGFAWVDTERCRRSAHPEFQCELEYSQQDDCGTFIRSDGTRLFSFHAHEVADMSNDMWDFVPPRFDHGLAFVRFPDGHVRGISTDGNPLPLHARYGGFASVDIPHQGDWPYIRYRGDWALVQLTNGWLGVLGADHDFAIGPSADTGMVLRAWKNGLVPDSADGDSMTVSSSP